MHTSFSAMRRLWGLALAGCFVCADIHVDVCVDVYVHAHWACVACRLKALAEAVVLSTGTSIPAATDTPSAMADMAGSHARILDRESSLLGARPRRLLRLAQHCRVIAFFDRMRLNLLGALTVAVVLHICLDASLPRQWAHFIYIMLYIMTLG